ncbi:Biotin carboxyl carrier protein of acetyl-CoA carboxylase [Corynebacterium glaucum]|uniref:Biotin carboxyl carrier protein of acetyl-CoA carboxylase n=1 Tax=Corynebacterium glaucum TaxID=187491 RepID=A0A1Q2HUV4_9CORY|nr:acetyl-CoA carboxylase biotin carboxyl carrier protein [Corynebacterium glaucum]AQQ14627.1 Biotin carboxyl carrier protein of acetyl-CoA carboxylase [Corynebacterium glaucum]
MSNTPNINEIKSLLEWVNQSGDIQELNIKYGDVELAMSRTPGGLNVAAPVAAPAAPVAPAPAQAEAPAAPKAEEAPAPAEAEAPAPAAADEKPAAPASSGNGAEVKSPMVGTFYAAPKPGADPFVKVGDTVEVGQVLCIVEVMKLMNNIEAKVAGTVTEILVENEDAVEHGQVLMVIEEK